MAVIVMLGGHGVGKSTALRRWKARYNRLETYLDDMRKQFYANEAKVQLILRLQQQPFVGVVETAKGYSAFMKSLRPTDPVLVVIPKTPELGQLWMTERKGKPLTAWWNRERVDYELRQKFKNFIRANNLRNQSKVFELASKTGWNLVDQEFGKIFRSLNNQLPPEPTPVPAFRVEEGCWEVVPDEDNTEGEGCWRVRWSIPDEQGRYHWVRHYGYGPGGNGARWSQHAAERNAEEFNKQGRRSWEFR